MTNQAASIFLLLIILPLSFSQLISASSPHRTIISSCSHARYPKLCIRTLSSLPTPPDPTPTALAVLAISAALDSLHSTVVSLRALPGSRPPPVGDCIQQLSDSADQLSKAREELAKASGVSEMVVDDACTWVSAALTNEDTCLDGVRRLDDGVNGGRKGVKGYLGRRVGRVERLTSNALYFVSTLSHV